MNARVPALAVLAALCLASAGCFGGGAGGDRSRGASSPRELVLASNDGVDLAGAPAVQRFVNQISARSGGRLVVRIAPAWKGGDDEARVIRDVAAGKADLGWSGTRAFDLVGVDAFRPLQAPFLITSYAAEAAVVRDDVAGQLLQSLKPIGLTGLALAADELRIVAARQRPVLTPSDLRGVVFRTSPSRIQTEAVAALGARPNSRPLPGSESTDIGAVETMWWTYQAQHQDEYAPFVTRNAVLWPRTVAVFANSRMLARLDDRSRRWITQAAGDAQAWSAMHAGDAEPAQIAAACSLPMRIATASDDQLAALRRAAEPVYVALRSDPDQAQILTRLEALVQSIPAQRPAPIPPACAYRNGDDARIGPARRPQTSHGVIGHLQEGVYRHTVTYDQLIAAGITENDAHNNAGVYTDTLNRGTWIMRQQPADTTIRTNDCRGRYTATSTSATFTTITKLAGGTCAPPTWTASWSATGKTLVWSGVSVSDFGPIWGGSWRRIR